MAEPKAPPDYANFRVRFFDERDDLIGARWWNITFRKVMRPDRRSLFKGLFWVSGTVALVAVVKTCGDRDDDVESMVDSLDLQQREGWNVGQTDGRVSIPDRSSTDVDGNGATVWQPRLPAMGALLTPSAALQPYYVSTLFHSLELPASESLRGSLGPMHGDAMEAAYQRGQALAALLNDADRPSDLAVILDLPGPESVAAAAALAEVTEPVFVFDNWPHPLGVVRSEQTLAACAYYLPRFVTARARRPATAAPVFVLDAMRLSPYRDQVSQFDNRYLARLPTPDGWKSLGVRRILYVRPDLAGGAAVELDDLNDEFVALNAAGIPVRMVSMADFLLGAMPEGAGLRYYWGGGPGAHVTFWPTYHWYTPSHYTWAPRPALRAAVPAPVFSSAAVHYAPATRSTIFSSRSVGGLSGIGRQKPAGFGRVSIRSDRASGRLTGVASGRSGSFGRSRSSFSG